ncbi:MAG: hypothetical protein ACRD07_09900 [Acidimicrobiales bacterium]
MTAADDRANVVRLDHRGSRRLGVGESVLWYGLAGASYVVLSIFHKWLLNWFIGPLWLVAFVWAGPALVDRAGPRSHRRPRGCDPVPRPDEPVPSGHVVASLRPFARRIREGDDLEPKQPRRIGQDPVRCRQAKGLMASPGLAPRDAFHAAHALAAACATIVSPDPAFDRVRGLERLGP